MIFVAWSLESISIHKSIPRALPHLSRWATWLIRKLLLVPYSCNSARPCNHLIWTKTTSCHIHYKETGKTPWTWSCMMTSNYSWMKLPKKGTAARTRLLLSRLYQAGQASLKTSSTRRCLPPKVQAWTILTRAKSKFRCQATNLNALSLTKAMSTNSRWIQIQLTYHKSCSHRYNLIAKWNLLLHLRSIPWKVYRRRWA